MGKEALSSEFYVSKETAPWRGYNIVETYACSWLTMHCRQAAGTGAVVGEAPPTRTKHASIPFSYPWAWDYACGWFTGDHARARSFQSAAIGWGAR